MWKADLTVDRILVGKGSEAPVERAFKAWLESTGWRLINDTGSWADVIAERGGERMIGEVKGYTGSSTGLDVDTMFGQLLRRMPESVVDKLLGFGAGHRGIQVRT